jgi:hypothetical protein
MCAQLRAATVIWSVTARVTTRFLRTRQQVLPAALFALLLAQLWVGTAAAQHSNNGHHQQQPPPPPSPSPTLTLTISPQMPSVPDSAPVGTVVATVTAAWSDGSPFTGTLSFGPPYNDDGGTFALSGNKLIISPTGLGIMGDGGTVQNVTIVATQ